MALGQWEDSELHLLGGGPAQQLQPGAELRSARQPAGLEVERPQLQGELLLCLQYY